MEDAAVELEVESPCECGGILTARLDQNRQVLSAWVRRPFEEEREKAPAHSIGAERDRFDVAWACGLCGRNTLRWFHVGALRRVAPAPPH